MRGRMRLQGLRKHLTVAVAAALFVALSLASAEATTIIRTGTSGTHKAWVRFDQASAGAPILVTLANISSSDVTLHADVLTAVFFNINGAPTLTKVSATLADQVNS